MRGASVVLAEKGFAGTGVATAAGNATTIHVAPRSEKSEQAIRRRIDLGFGLAERRWIERAIDDGAKRASRRGPSANMWKFETLET